MNTTIDKPATTTTTLAILPAQLLYVAAQFASKDAAKQALQYINVRKADDTITIAATDGHRLFRVRIPAAKAWYLDRELMINSAAFKKRVAKSETVIITNHGIAEHRNPALIQSVPCSTGCDFTYPEYDRLIPDSFTNNPQKPIAFNADYLAAFLKEVARYCLNGTVKMQFNSATTPLIFTSTHRLAVANVDVELEYLLMPVLTRA